uniref:Telomerase reverse transcriptase n=1 Tax=Panagrellus redivivus TaxID=6233 RepID=A0A7E4ZYH4_PANRE
MPHKRSRKRKLADIVHFDGILRPFRPQNANFLVDSKRRANVAAAFQKLINADAPSLVKFVVTDAVYAKLGESAASGNTSAQRILAYLTDFTRSFFKKWKALQIEYVLDKFLKDIRGDNAAEIWNSASFPQLRALLCYLFEFLFPEGFLHPDNINALNHNFARLFADAKMSQPLFTTSVLMRGVESSKLRWLDVCSEPSQRLMARSIVVFASEVVLAFFLKAFYAIPTVTERIKWYRREAWQRVTSAALKQFLCDREAVESSSKILDIYYKLKFIPKGSSLRPIEMLIDTKKLCRMDIIRVSLQYLQAKNGISNGFAIPNCNKVIGHRLRMLIAKSSKYTEYFAMSSDISNCFPSLRHDILEEALTRIIQPVDLVLYAATFRVMVTVSPTKGTSRSKMETLLSVGSSIDDARECLKTRLQRNGKAKVSVIVEPLSVKSFPASKLLPRIRYLAMQTTVAYGGKFYSCRRGVSQGSALSTLLCNIYLAYVEECVFNSFFRSIIAEKAMFIRYMDDYLLVSRDYDVAVDVIELLFEDFRKYGIHISQDKTRFTVNLVSLRGRIQGLTPKNFVKGVCWMHFCGLGVNMSTLELSLDPARLKSLNHGKTIANAAIEIHRNPVKSLNLVMSAVRRSLSTKLATFRVCRRIFQSSLAVRNLRQRVFHDVFLHVLKHFFRRVKIRPRSRRIQVFKKALWKLLAEFIHRNRRRQVR